MNRRILKIMAIILGCYLALWLPAVVTPQYLDSPFGLLVAVPYLSIYLFNSMGIPWLLQHNGACGWGWCSPTLFGWIFLVVFWLFVVWIFARLLTGMSDRPTKGE